MKKILKTELYNEPNEDNLCQEEIDSYREILINYELEIENSENIFIRLGDEKVRTNADDLIPILEEQIKFIKQYSK